MTYVPNKLFGRVLIDIIRDGVNSKMGERKAGFRSWKGTVEHIFILRNIIKQVEEWQVTVYITFVGDDTELVSSYYIHKCKQGQDN